MSKLNRNPLSFLSALLFLALYAYHLSVVVQTAVDVPYRDEWQIFSLAWLSSPPTDWLISRHNEHFIVTSKLLIWLMYKICAWNVKFHLILNFLLFGSALVLFKRSVSRFRAHWHLPSALNLSLALLLSNLAWENHTWAFQSSFHLFLLCMLSGTALLSLPRRALWEQCCGMFLLLLCIISLSTGPAAVAAIGLVFASCAAIQFGVKGLHKSVFWLLFGGAALLFELLRHQNTSWLAQGTVPTELLFWDFFLNLVALGFGFETYSYRLGALCLLTLLLPLVFIAPLLSAKKNGLAHFTFAMAAGLLASLAAIAYGRASAGDVAIWSKGSRYAEIAGLLVPISVLAWECSARNINKRLRWLFVALPLVLASVGYANNWGFSHYYWIEQQKHEGLRCVETILRGDQSTSNICPTLTTDNIGGKLRQAEELKLSFVEKFLDTP